ncbi:hypothetical protein [Rhizobium sp. BK650]|uniref:hypothetical protein n=1 Tax=Rhizobium sp. BK650 TaxID=2586990 RepID=UPI001AEDF76F|nr:hypothetical protein [Rhizobium sp. BK650]
MDYGDFEGGGAHERGGVHTDPRLAACAGRRVIRQVFLVLHGLRLVDVNRGSNRRSEPHARAAGARIAAVNQTDAGRFKGAYDCRNVILHVFGRDIARFHPLQHWNRNIGRRGQLRLGEICKCTRRRELSSDNHDDPEYEVSNRYALGRELKG